MQKFSINMNPVSCPRPRVTKFGVYYPKKYNDYKKSLCFMLKALKMEKMDKERPLELSVTFNIEIPKSYSGKKKQELDGTFVVKKPDIDNFLKSIMDGMSGISYHDDNQIVIINCKKIYTIGKGSTDVELKYIGE